ncbi:MAG TPA: molybdopterin cofactor-binding domain-containing protein, partial [Polyangia bacterium]
LAKVLRLPASRIRVIATPNGGGFGGKSDPFNHEIVAAKAALVTGRPVKISLTREEVFYCHRGRHPVLMHLRTGVAPDGTILGMQLDTLLDGGAYGSYGVASTFYTGALQTVTYHVPRYRFRGCRVFTNKAPCGPKRGHGTPQPRFGLEVHIDKICERLGIDPRDVRAVTGDTDLGPVDLGSYSSRVTLMMGNAAIEAAERARALLAGAVAEKLKLPAARLVFADGRVFDVEEPGRGVAFADAVQLAEARHGTLGTTGSYRPPKSPGDYKGAGVGPSPAYSYSAAVVEVEVDRATGWLRVPKIWIAHDVGRAINPTLARGQVEGSVYMGLGEALMEEQEFRRLPPKLSRGLVHKFPSMLEYKSPGTLDMPDVETILVEEPDPNGPFGAKEVGQGPLLPIMPAVANAVFDAVGVRVDEVPITPEKILKALGSTAKRFGPARFPAIPWPEPLLVPPPWEGGDGKAVNEPPRRRDRVRGATVAPPVEELPSAREGGKQP